MTRITFTNSMCAHVWAQRSQNHGEGSKGSIFFRGDTIYSYGSHFPIARFVDRPPCETVVFFTARSYSVTTAKHINHVHKALNYGRDMPVFFVNDPTGEYHDANLARYAGVMEQAALKARRARSNSEWHLKDAERTNEEATAYAKFFGLTWNAPEIDPAALDAKIKEQRSAAAKLAAARKAKEAEQIADATAKFRDGKPAHFPVNAPILLRIAGDAIQTSRGASVPVDHAKRLFTEIKRCRDTGETYQANGFTINVGHFRVDTIDSAGNLKAGCHSIAWPEIERCAAELGLA